MVAIIILCILGGLIILIGFLMSSDVIAYIEHNDDFTIRVRYLFLTLYPRNKPKKRGFKKKPHKSKTTNNKIKNNKTKERSFVSKVADNIKKDSKLDEVMGDVKKFDKNKKKSVGSFDFEVIKLTYDTLKSPIKRLIKRIRITKLETDFTVASNDAAKTAISYGVQSVAARTFLTWLDNILVLKIKRVNITADFEKERSQFYIKCRIKIRVFWIALLLIRYIINTAKQPLKGGK